MKSGRVIIVGGSVAASTAIQTLRVEGFDGDITLISDEAVEPYSRVPLSKGVLAGREAFETLGGLGESGVDARLSTRAVALDVANSTLLTATEEMRYDRLLVATGARARRIGAPGQRELVLRDVDDVTALRMRLEGATSVVVVGGGVLGMEVASTCAGLGLSVTVVDMVPPMSRLLGSSIARRVVMAANLAGVRVKESPGGVQLLGQPHPSGVLCADGTTLTADAVISAVGDVPNVEWLTGSGLRLRAGVIIDDRCRAAERVFAAGDVTTPEGHGGGAARLPTFTNAVEQGRIAALAMLYGADGPRHEPSRYMWTEQFALDIKMAGAAGPVGEPQVVEGDLAAMSALLAWPDMESATTVMSVNFRIPVARLKRGVTSAASAPAEGTRQTL